MPKKRKAVNSSAQLTAFFVFAEAGFQQSENDANVRIFAVAKETGERRYREASLSCEFEPLDT